MGRLVTIRNPQAYEKAQRRKQRLHAKETGSIKQCIVKYVENRLGAISADSAPALYRELLDCPQIFHIFRGRPRTKEYRYDRLCEALNELYATGELEKHEDERGFLIALPRKLALETPERPAANETGAVRELAFTPGHFRHTHKDGVLRELAHY